MSQDILRIASLKFQEKFIIHPTQEKYASLEDMINEFRSDQEPYLSWLSPDKRVFVLDFAKIFRHKLNMDFHKRYADACKSGEEGAMEKFVRHDPDWIAIRNAARECVNSIGYDLEKWEREQGC